MTTLTFLGQSAVLLEADGRHVLVDPFLSDNPKATTSPDDVPADVILVTHGHGDHLGDAVAIARRTGAPIVAIVEVANELAEEGVEVVDLNLGGTHAFDGGWARLVPAWHTGTTPKGTVATPGGFVIHLGGKTIYHLGDTALFSDLALPGRRDRLDAALIPIGGHYTMDRHDAVEAARLVGAPVVIPVHYDTFPPIETDAQAFKADVEDQGVGRVEVLAPNDTLEL
ncbi:metal-dependent hydrolase [Patulibacter sp. SYSU D01012]|uniref:metal-dependent hydrolase n=1 Tax=Patulibacter sp. SYSU D01012 TaxID=2817381 RepID=UPI001B312114|nr:metal-dependent hydrolase [Patulibacter sp. SYSU D01012]